MFLLPKRYMCLFYFVLINVFLAIMDRSFQMQRKFLDMKVQKRTVWSDAKDRGGKVFGIDNDIASVVVGFCVPTVAARFFKHGNPSAAKGLNVGPEVDSEKVAATPAHHRRRSVSLASLSPCRGRPGYSPASRQLDDSPEKRLLDESASPESVDGIELASIEFEDPERPSFMADRRLSQANIEEPEVWVTVFFVKKLKFRICFQNHELFLHYFVIVGILR